MLEKIKNGFQQEFLLIVDVLNEKGAKRFSRAFFAGGLIIVFAYFGLYTPFEGRADRLQAQIREAKTMSENAKNYELVRDQLTAAYGGLPGLPERDQWLSTTVRTSLSVEGLVTDSFKPVAETELNGLILQTSEVSLSMKFAEFFDWILRLEASRPNLMIRSFELRKQTKPLGFNTVSASVGTIIPKRRFR